MPLFTLADAELAYGDVPLLDRAALAMEAGERIGLIGRNGTGKSSLLGILAGSVALDDGALHIWPRGGFMLTRCKRTTACASPTCRRSPRISISND